MLLLKVAVTSYILLYPYFNESFLSFAPPCFLNFNVDFLSEVNNK